MNPVKSIWLSLLLPTLACAVPAAAATYWYLGSPLAAVSILAACLFSTTAIAHTLSRHRQAASAQLRRPELRHNSDSGTGAYASLLEEAIGLVEHLETESSEATRSRTEIEARSHVRQRQVQQLEAALGFLEDPLLITDAHDQLLFFNPASLPLLLANSDESGDSQSKKRPSLDRIDALKQLLDETRSRSAANDRRSHEFELTVGNTTIAYRATANNVYDNQDRLLGVVTLLRDIRDEQKEKTQHAEFVSSVCHELKTPMASIRAYTEMLIDNDFTEADEQQEVFGFIEAQVDRLTRLVDNMLNLTRIQSGVIKVQREDCELNSVLQKAFNVVRPTADEKQIRLVLELSDLYLAAHVDCDLFGQAVINLLSNAIKYTPNGGEVRLQSRMLENRAVVEVADNGMGIPNDSLPHIFDRFYRVPENNKAAAGTGLGLALVKYIVTELHNGQISVTSQVDEGTCFSVSVPLGHCNPNRKKLQPVSSTV